MFAHVLAVGRERVVPARSLLAKVSIARQTGFSAWEVFDKDETLLSQTAG